MRLFLSFVAFSFCILTFSFAQQLQSPEQFLGYKVGAKFSRHHKIVEYFRAVATAKSDMVKIEKYGETNEGRELILAYVALPENLQKLEEIRKNNLRLTGIEKDKAGSTANAPAIVWLSYNVHGNEPASSEAAMLTLYALVDPANKQTKEWLKNTVVILDPCINPDGRDRYVNWYNSYGGKNFNPDPQAREHNEPWPQGRTNHFNFDLNRDWAWQTQIESQQRMKKYNEWMPQVHVDYHEQGFNQPYYFAPAAEPYHEVITQWQKDFQVLIGKNNAKYFDENGWLFFTKERFDLFYPSYGDTYPTYNGAIGMTFEQGGIRGGLGIKNEDGDTLTLVDRATHHFTTGLSTIEVVSKNAQKLVDEFKKFFDESKAAKASEYKTYVVTSDEPNKILAVKALLDKNGIEYGSLSGKIKGYRYFSGREEELPLNKYTLAVSAYQPRSAMVKVLFEPKSKLSDSATYDITAWSVPYVYGVEGIALKEKKELAAFNATSNNIVLPVNAYGYLVQYNALNSAQVLAYLLKNKIKVRIATKPFSFNNKSYERGTLIVLKTSNAYNNFGNIVNEATKKFNVAAETVNSGFVDKGADFGSPDVRTIKAPNVALLTGDQVSSGDAGEVWNLFDQTLDYPVTLLQASDIARLSLQEYDVIIMPDGNYRSLNDKLAMEKLKDFVRDGGRIVAMQNAVSVLAKNDFGFKLKEDKSDEKSKDDYEALKKYADREKEDLTNSIPGAIYKVDLDTTHPLAFGYDQYYFTLKQDAGICEFLKDGWNVGVIKKDNYVAGFSGYKVKNKLKDGTLIGVQDYGRGSVIFFADNPIFRMFWENGKLILCNAIFMVQQ
jgi:hypothetical protein